MSASTRWTRAILAVALACALAARPDGAEAGRKTRRVGSCGGFQTPDHPGWREWELLTRAAVRREWDPPPEARQGLGGLVLVRAHVLPDGTIDDVVVVKRRGTEAMEKAATGALLHASPLPPLPPDPDSDTPGAHLNYQFAYNVTDEQACRFRDRWSP